jgi:hypothetical protein
MGHLIHNRAANDIAFLFNYPVKAKMATFWPDPVKVSGYAYSCAASVGKNVPGNGLAGEA